MESCVPIIIKYAICTPETYTEKPKLLAQKKFNAMVLVSIIVWVQSKPMFFFLFLLF